MRPVPALALALCTACGGSSDLPAPHRGTDVEPVVAAALEAARDRAAATPTAETLGAYGCLLHGNGWMQEAAECYGLAMAADPRAYRWPYLRGIALATVDPAASLASFEQAVERDPDYLVGRYKTALLCTECEQTDRARAHLQVVLERDPAFVPALLALARIELADQQVERSRDLLVEALTRMPDHPEVHETLARVYFRLQDDARARYHAAEAQRHRRKVPVADPRADLDLPPISSRDHLEHGVAAAARQDLEQAIAHFQRALELRPDSYEALYNLAMAHQEHGDSGAAEEFYRRCQELREGDLASGRRLLDLMAQSGRARQAYELVNGWISKDASSAELELAAAWLAIQVDQKPVAARHARAARPLAAGDGSLLRQCADILTRAQALADAVACYEDLLILDPEDREARVQRGILRGRQGDYASAIQDFERVLARQGDHELARANLVTACQALATQHMQDGAMASAIPLFERALDLQPGLVQSLRGLAWILATTGEDALRDPPRALSLAEEAAAASDTPVVRDTLAAALAACGRFDEAAEQAERALEASRRQGRDEQSERIQKRLELYRQGKPFQSGPGR